MLNEFRQDPISGRWTLFATGRAKNHLGQKTESFYKPINECVFEDLEKASGDKPLLVFSHGKIIDWNPQSDWTTAVVKNKFPVVNHGVCSEISNQDFWPRANATGYHELVITRNHDKFFAQFNDSEMKEVVEAYQERFNIIDRDACGDYVLILHNHGLSAGASIYHNHSQIISLPFVPPGIASDLARADEYLLKYGVSPFDVMLEKEMSEAKRVVYQNDNFVVFCPYASRTPYEMRLYSKNKESQFEKLNSTELEHLAQALRITFAKLSSALDDPDYNFYIHASPFTDDGKLISNAYRWHIEIVPRLSAIASVELSTGIFVNVVDPDEAAKFLTGSAGSDNVDSV